jgi:hypothetical protein
LKALVRGAIRAGRSRSGAGDGGRFAVAVIRLKDGPLPALHDDRRPPAERTASGRYLQPG